MLPESTKDRVFISTLLSQRHPVVAERLAMVLERHGIPLSIIAGTRDIWARDYMPVQVAEGRWVQFRYEPNYLIGRDDQRTLPSDITHATPAAQTNASDLIADGGNIVGTQRRAFLTDYIYRANAPRQREEIRNQLRQALAVEELILVPAEPGDALHHVDGVLRPLDDQTLIVNDYGSDLAGYRERLLAVLRRLDVKIVLLPYAPTDEVNDGIAAAVGVYLNYLQVGSLLVMPTFGLATDDAALRILAAAAPQCMVEPLRCEGLAREGGLLNCVTWTTRGLRV